MSTFLLQVQNSAEQYEKELKLSELESSMKKLQRRGSAILENLYTQKEVGRMLSVIHKATEIENRFSGNENLFAIRSLLKELPALKSIIFNSNLCTLIREGFGTDYFLTKAIYFDKPPQSNWYVTWHQDVPINVVEKKETVGFRGWTNKEGLVSVMPPVDFLHSSFTVRIHLDDTDEKKVRYAYYPEATLVS